MLGELVHAVAAEFGRDHTEISGRVVVLDVQGSWWYLVSPGGALCSIEAANDRSTARHVVTAVFRSTLAEPH